MQKESELIKQLREGDIEAYKTLLALHLPALSRYVTRMIGNAADAEEIIQDVFLNLWQKAKQFDSNKTKLTTWLHAIAYHKCIDFFRKNKMSQNKALKDNVSTRNIDDVQGLNHQQESNSPQQALLRSQENAMLSNAIRLLPEGQRSALVLCHYQGLSNREAAKVLSISVPALESLLSRARKKLQTHLEGKVN